MNIKRILCPIDYSEFSRASNVYASTLAKSTGARIIYLYSAMPDVPFGSYANLNLEYEEKQELKKLEEIKPTVDGVEASYVIEFGPPAEQIVQFANQNDIDVIVVGTHGRTGVMRVLMGSVAEAVVRKAECPVLAIKSNADVFQTS